MKPERDLRQYYPGLAAQVGRTFRRVIDEVRDAAEGQGYALTVHGSLSRDIDLVAVPWRDDASSAAEVAKAIREAAAMALHGVTECEPFGMATDPVKKPHGRLAWTFVFIKGGYIDLSVMPRIVVTEPAVAPLQVPAEPAT